MLATMPLRVVPDGFAQFSQREENPHAVVIEVGTGFQRRSITVRRLEVTVVLLFPLMYAVELRCDTVLHQGGLCLPLDLFVYLAVYQFVSLGQGCPFQRVRSGNLRLGQLRKQTGKHKDHPYANDS